MRSALGHFAAVSIGALAGVLAELAFGTSSTWFPRSPLAWLVAVIVFVLGEGFFHWFIRQAKRVADEDVLFRGLHAPGRSDRDRDVR